MCVSVAGSLEAAFARRAARSESSTGAPDLHISSSPPRGDGLRMRRQPPGAVAAPAEIVEHNDWVMLLSAAATQDFDCSGSITFAAAAAAALVEDFKHSGCSIPTAAWNFPSFTIDGSCTEAAGSAH
mmetsp:Transcript_94839/g.168449  ORF Transcript_94839/g.168449 Transcript_94839/m.168449 type:complete len:127 (-) Transcript_94839:832-1212(-)